MMRQRTQRQEIQAGAYASGGLLNIGLMVQHAVDVPTLPYTLKRPFFRFFKVFSCLLLLIALGMGLAMHRDGLLLALLFGGPLWFGLSMGVVFNWQSLSLLSDRLVFHSFGKTYPVLYRDIRQAEAILETSIKGGNVLTLRLHHAGEEKSPLQINLKLFGSRERQILLRVIRQLAPQAQLNHLAQQIQNGEASAF